MKGRPSRNRPSSDSTTVEPANTTARPDVAIAVTTAASGADPECRAFRYRVTRNSAYSIPTPAPTTATERAYAQCCLRTPSQAGEGAGNPRRHRCRGDRRPALEHHLGNITGLAREMPLQE